MSPHIQGQPIEIRFAPQLRAHRGKLVSGKAAPGREVHAASFIRQRRIILDSSLKKKPAELRRILVHELFHFAWVRLGNPRRRSFEAILTLETRRGVRGELGWSAEHLKAALSPRDRRLRTRPWREYVCESFCDSGAWMLSPTHRHEEFTLSAGSCRKRRAWFENALLSRQISV